MQARGSWPKLAGVTDARRLHCRSAWRAAVGAIVDMMERCGLKRMAWKRRALMVTMKADQISFRQTCRQTPRSLDSTLQHCCQNTGAQKRWTVGRYL